MDELTHDLIEEQNVNQETSDQLDSEIKDRLRWQNEFNLEKQRADESEKVRLIYLIIRVSRSIYWTLMGNCKIDLEF